MAHHRLNSSNLYSIAHEGETLEVRFNCSWCGGSGKASGSACPRCASTGHTGGHVYRGVPAKAYEEILKASSPGKAFNTLVKGKFLGKRMEEDRGPGK